MKFNKKITVVIEGPLVLLLTELSEGYAQEHPGSDMNSFVSGCLSNYFSHLVRKALEGGDE